MDQLPSNGVYLLNGTHQALYFYGGSVNYYSNALLQYDLDNNCWNKISYNSEFTNEPPALQNALVTKMRRYYNSNDNRNSRNISPYGFPDLMIVLVQTDAQIQVHP